MKLVIARKAKAGQISGSNASVIALAHYRMSRGRSRSRGALTISTWAEARELNSLSVSTAMLSVTHTVQT